MRVVEDDLTDPRVLDLLALHARGMLDTSPPESAHFLDVSGLQASDVTFWTAWDDDALAGCGALKELDPRHGELKSFRTHPDHLRRGVADLLVSTALDAARARRYAQVSLETGTGPAFEAAHRLYERHGFVETGPFADYVLDPFSRFMVLEL